MILKVSEYSTFISFINEMVSVWILKTLPSYQWFCVCPNMLTFSLLSMKHHFKKNWRLLILIAIHLQTCAYMHIWNIY